MAQAIRRDLRVLSTIGFEVKDKGERKLKGLENPEYIYLMYPHSLAGRLIVEQQRANAGKALSAENPAVISNDSQLGVEAQTIWDLWEVSLRLEMICSSLECPDRTTIKPPETIMLERTKLRAGEVTDRVLVQFLEHLVCRVETCISTLVVRNTVNPFTPGRSLLEKAAPMADVLSDLAEQLRELKAYKDEQEMDMGPA